MQTPPNVNAFSETFEWLPMGMIKLTPSGALITERERLDSLLSDAVLELGISGKVCEAAGGTVALFGFGPDQLIGRAWHEWLSDDDRARLETAKEPVEVKVRASGGRVRTCSVTPHQAADGSRRLVFRDVGDQQRARAEAQAATEAASHSERFAIIGRLSSGLGHELNNPLSYLTTNLGALREELGLVEAGVGEDSMKEMRSMIDDCEEGVRRLVCLVQALESSSRQAPVKAGDAFDPARAMGHAITLFGGVHRHRVTVDWEARSLPLVSGAAATLSQVMLSLLQNAADATGGRGRVTVSSSAQAGDGRVVIEVTDQGSGIPPEAQARVFDAFACGRGLGLHLARKLVQELGGTLDFRTGEAGTTFVVRLPMVADEDA